MAQLNRHHEDQRTLLRYAHHIARDGAPNSVAGAVALATDEKRTPVERLDLLKSIQEGAQERGSSWTTQREAGRSIGPTATWIVATWRDHAGYRRRPRLPVPRSRPRNQDLDREATTFLKAPGSTPWEP